MLRRSLAVARATFFASSIAFVLTGCASDPTAPMDTRTDAATAMLSATLPMRGTLAATEAGTFNPANNSLRILLTGEGQATHVGRYTLALDIQLDLATATSTGTFVLTAADGSTLNGSLTGIGIRLPNNIADVTESMIITGGTGRFVGASGRFTVSRIVDQSTGISQGTLEGFLDK